MTVFLSWLFIHPPNVPKIPLKEQPAASACDGVSSAAFGLGALHLGRLETIASIALKSNWAVQGFAKVQVYHRFPKASSCFRLLIYVYIPVIHHHIKRRCPRRGMSSGSMLKNLEIAWFGKMQFHSDAASFVSCYYQTSHIKLGNL